MIDKAEGFWKYLASAMIFPVFFQEPFIQFAWSVESAGAYVTFLKRVFLLLPFLAIVFACWATVVCGISLVFRHERRDFASAVFVTWWDLGRSIFAYWAGIIRFVFSVLAWLYAFLRLVITGIILTLKDFFSFPLRLVSEVSSGTVKAGVPWPAIFLMLVWTIIESLIFTLVMTPLVVDVMDGFSDGEMVSSLGLQTGLFFTFIIFVLGSYAVIFTLGDAIKKKNIPLIVLYAIVEIIVAVVETILFYREFVDALVPWFAQYAGDDFSLGIVGTLSIAFLFWLGIRCMTWFLFGSSAIPILIAMIQRTGLDDLSGKKTVYGSLFSKSEKKDFYPYIATTLESIKKDWEWVEHQGDVLVSSFVLPPLQILAASINFCTLILSNNHLFKLPFTSYKNLKDTRELLRGSRNVLGKSDE
jgi:hypothetical protein